MTKSKVKKTKKNSSSITIDSLLKTSVKSEQVDLITIMQALLDSQPVAMIVQIVPGTQQVTAILLPPSDDPDLAYEAGVKLLQGALRVWTEQGLIARQARAQFARDTKKSGSEEHKKNE